MTECSGLRSEEIVELGDRDLTTLQKRPRIAVRVRRIDTADEVDRQVALGLVSTKRLERARQDHSTEVPQHRPLHEEHRRQQPLRVID